MKKLFPALFVLPLLVFVGCTQLYTTTINVDKQPLPDSTEVFTYIAGRDIFGEIEVIGSIEVNTNAQKSCNMQKFEAEAHEIARAAGGNALIVQEIDLKFSCLNFTGHIARITYAEDTALIDRESLKETWSNRFDPIEGIYESTGPNLKDMEVGVLKNNTGGYSLIYLNGTNNEYRSLWKEGNLKAKLSNTGAVNTFKATWLEHNRTYDTSYLISFSEGIMSLINTEAEVNQPFLKMYPTQNSFTSASGSGFAISEKGYIVTNHHVIEGAETITVKGINGDFNKIFEAEVIVTDQRNDLAVIKIDTENEDIDIGPIPFQLKSDLSQVGNEVFVLGYPLRATMGDELKLTTGIISSRTGFQGDITSYQISAPVQPGNSGGPTFDMDGNLIGIVNAKHAGAENASYSVKANYLINLFELLPEEVVLDLSNNPIDVSLADLVKSVRNHVYIIEVE